MEPKDDLQLREILREWQVEDPPASLDARVLGARPVWWRFLIRGSMRVPVPVALACAMALTLMGTALVRMYAFLPPPPTPARSQGINLADFRPVQEVRVRIIEGHP